MLGVESNNENLRLAVEKIEEAASKNVDIVVLPEMFSCPYKASNFPVYAQKDGEYNWKVLSETAKKNNIYLVAGSMPERDGDKVYNTSYVFDRSGKQIGKHRKMHLFDCDVPGGVTFHESETLTGGDDITVFETEFGKMGLMICFDIRFPELSRLMALRGAKMIIVPAAFNLTSGPRWWDIMFRTRATDNQVFMAGCSPARDENGCYVAWGHSLVVDPFGKILNQLDEKEAILYQELDLSEIETFRQQYQIFKSRRLDIYELTEKSR